MSSDVLELEPPEVSVVMPCLNEVDTVALCIEKAPQAFGFRTLLASFLLAIVPIPPRGSSA